MNFILLYPNNSMYTGYLHLTDVDLKNFTINYINANWYTNNNRFRPIKNIKVNIRIEKKHNISKICNPDTIIIAGKSNEVLLKEYEQKYNCKIFLYQNNYISKIIENLVDKMLKFYFNLDSNVQIKYNPIKKSIKDIQNEKLISELLHGIKLSKKEKNILYPK